MASESVASSGSGLPKWQIALAVGAPIAVGVAVGAYYYRKSQSGSSDPEGGKTEPDGSAATANAKSTEPKRDERVRNSSGLKILPIVINIHIFCLTPRTTVASTISQGYTLRDAAFYYSSILVFSF